MSWGCGVGVLGTKPGALSLCRQGSSGILFQCVDFPFAIYGFRIYGVVEANPAW